MLFGSNLLFLNDESFISVIRLRADIYLDDLIKKSDEKLPPSLPTPAQGKK